jgi:hypothetical protein
MLLPRTYENDSELYELFPRLYQSHFSAYILLSPTPLREFRARSANLATLREGGDLLR